jgi:hypothetical protein
MPHQPDHSHMDLRIAECIMREKEPFDRYRPLPNDTIRRLNKDLIHPFYGYVDNYVDKCSNCG